MDAFHSAICDSIYSNYSAPAAVSVDDHGYFNQVPMDDLQQRMWLGGFMNVEMDLTRSSFIPSSSVYLGDSSNLLYRPMYSGRPAALPTGHGQVPAYAQAYNNNVDA